MLTILKLRAIQLGTLVRYISGRFVGYKIAVMLGVLAFIVLRGRRHQVRDNLINITGNTSGIWRNFVNFALTYADFLAIPRMRCEDFKKLAQPEGLQYLDEALSLGRGVIFISAHMANTELAACYITSYGYDTVTVAELRGTGARWYEVMNKFRSHTGMEVLPLEDTSTPKRIIERLRANKVVVLLGDRDITGSGVEVCFLGKRMNLPKGPARLALATGSPIVTAFLVRDGPKYKAWVDPIIDYSPTGNKEKDIKNITQIIAKRIEAVIRKYPHQWHVFQVKWDELTNCV